MKKLLALLLTVVMLLALVACGGNNGNSAGNNAGNTGSNNTSDNAGAEDTSGDTAASDIKVGFIFLHDENSTYDLNFINGANCPLLKQAIPAHSLFFR